MVNTPGSPALICRIPSMVSTAAFCSSSCPVVMGRVRASKIRLSGERPYSPQTMAWIFCAASSFQAAVVACPRSSMHRAIARAPWAFIRGTQRSIRSARFSRLMELSTARPG